MSYSIIIHSQDSNRYHKEGDLCPFGHTTLLEWKISQCLEIFNRSDIFISTSSKKSALIAKNNKLGLIHRKENLSYADVIMNDAINLSTDHLVLVNATSPFISSARYKKIIDVYLSNSGKYDSLITTIEKRDFAFYLSNKINFDKSLDGREILDPVHLASNGVYIVNREKILAGHDTIGDKPFFYNLDYLESIEINEKQTFHLASELIALYFKKLRNII
jgi:CMP-N-acetylneuraminic acid synthetase